MNKYYLLGLIPVALSAHVQSVYAQVYMTTEQAQKSMFQTATTFIENTITFTKEQKKQVRKISDIRDINDEQKIWKVMQNNKHLGYFILDKVYGKHEFITYAIAIDTDGVVISTDILEYKESYGGQVKEPWWRKQFIGKKVTDKFELDTDITNISGATLSCKHIADGIKRVLTVYDLYVKNQAK